MGFGFRCGLILQSIFVLLIYKFDGIYSVFAVRGGVYFLPKIYCHEVIIQTLVWALLGLAIKMIYRNLPKNVFFSGVSFRDVEI